MYFLAILQNNKHQNKNTLQNLNQISLLSMLSDRNQNDKMSIHFYYDIHLQQKKLDLPPHLLHLTVCK